MADNSRHASSEYCENYLPRIFVATFTGQGVSGQMTGRGQRSPHNL